MIRKVSVVRNNFVTYIIKLIMPWL